MDYLVFWYKQSARGRCRGNNFFPSTCAYSKMNMKLYNCELYNYEYNFHHSKLSMFQTVLHVILVITIYWVLLVQRSCETQDFDMLHNNLAFFPYCSVFLYPSSSKPLWAFRLQTAALYSWSSRDDIIQSTFGKRKGVQIWSTYRFLWPTDWLSFNLML